MARLTPHQRRWRARVERGIALAAPALDAILWVGERVAGIAGRDDPGYDPPRRPAPDSPVRAGVASEAVTSAPREAG